MSVACSMMLGLYHPSRKFAHILPFTWVKDTVGCYNIQKGASKAGSAPFVTGFDLLKVTRQAFARRAHSGNYRLKRIYFFQAEFLAAGDVWNFSFSKAKDCVQLLIVKVPVDTSSGDEHGKSGSQSISYVTRFRRVNRRGEARQIDRQKLFEKVFGFRNNALVINESCNSVASKRSQCASFVANCCKERRVRSDPKRNQSYSATGWLTFRVCVINDCVDWFERQTVVGGGLRSGTWFQYKLFKFPIFIQQLLQRIVVIRLFRRRIYMNWSIWRGRLNCWRAFKKPIEKTHRNPLQSIANTLGLQRDSVNAGVLG